MPYQKKKAVSLSYRKPQKLKLFMISEHYIPFFLSFFHGDRLSGSLCGIGLP